MIKLPEPAMKSMSLSNEWTPFYTESQMRQAIRDAYEDAAKVCEAADDWHPQEVIAESIRKLKEQVE